MHKVIRVLTHRLFTEKWYQCLQEIYLKFYLKTSAQPHLCFNLLCQSSQRASFECHLYGVPVGLDHYRCASHFPFAQPWGQLWEPGWSRCGDPWPSAICPNCSCWSCQWAKGLTSCLKKGFSSGKKTLEEMAMLEEEAQHFTYSEDLKRLDGNNNYICFFR